MASPTSPGGADVPPVLPSIPLAPEAPRSDDRTVGALVREVTTQLSTLVRAEVELARSEVTAELRKGVTGGIYFAVAAVIGLFSLFFLFFTFAELLAIWLNRAASFAIVFGVMLVAAGLIGLLGYLKVRKIHKPERTIESLRESAHVLQHRGRTGTGPSELGGAASGSTAR